MVKFYLRSPTNDWSTLKTRVYLNKRRVETCPGSVRVPVDLWDKKTQRVRYDPNMAIAADINNLLEQTNRAVINYLYQCQCERRAPDPGRVRAVIIEVMTGAADQLSFVDHLDQYVARRAASGKLARFTVKKETNMLQLFRHYIQETGPVGWDMVNAPMVASFETWMLGRGYSTNYVATNLNILKRAVRDGAQHVPGGVDWLRHVKIKTAPVESVYLTENELDQLVGVSLPSSKLDHVRDLFVAMCLTGVAYADISKITENVARINGVDVLTVRRKKTNVTASIPIGGRLRRILDKYDGQLPRVMSNQKFNAYIKEVAQLAGIDHPVVRSHYSGATVTRTTQPKWSLITTHTARRTFATLAVLSGIPIADIMKLTGHRTTTAFMQYVKLDGQTVAASVANNRLFK